MRQHLKKQIRALIELEQHLDYNNLNRLIKDIETTIKNNKKIIATALGKNVPLCEKFIGTLVSLGINGHFMHTNSAVHGDLGLIKDGDLVIILTKSGETTESVYLYHHLIKRKIKIWLLTYNEKGTLTRLAKNKVILYLKHEGDKWNLVPNNSSIGFLLVLQAIAMRVAEDLNVNLKTFKENHPGGYIGKLLSERGGK